VRLNYLDWRGTGPALILIHGLADSPHVFDDLASSLRDQFHVIAYARRGHGHSDAPAGPYGQETLVEDLRQFLDQLAIPRASLLGWSMGGNEITAFAARYPDRVEKLIYLESGYDWSDSTFQKAFPVPNPDPAALLSLDAYRVWYHRTWFGDAPWTPGLEAYLRDIVRIDSAGAVHPIPSGPVLDSLVASNASSSRDYSKVRAPALALYASSMFPVDPAAPERRRVSQDWEDHVMRAFRRASIERVRRELAHVLVRDVSNTAHMSILVAAPDTVTTMIRTFLRAGGDK
jgi:pimeloyl-ACP methyl ester carboxylesterase